jgi:hypothetical protein
MGSTVPLDPEHAEAIGELAGCADVLADYDDAAHAIRRWFAQTLEPEAPSLSAPAADITSTRLPLLCPARHPMSLKWLDERALPWR